MISSIFPFRAIVFQFLFLLIAIAIESIIYRRRMRLGFRTSVQYAASVNLLSVVVGWLIFFIVVPLLPEPLKTQFISYIFFDQFYADPWASSIPSIVITIGFIIFFGTFALKIQGLDLLELALGKKKEDKKELPSHQDRYSKRPQDQNIFQRAGARATTVLLANACSFSAILLVLFIRLLGQA
jgi:hypothetical protein